MKVQAEKIGFVPVRITRLPGGTILHEELSKDLLTYDQALEIVQADQKDLVALTRLNLNARKGITWQIFTVKATGEPVVLEVGRSVAGYR